MGKKKKVETGASSVSSHIIQYLQDEHHLTLKQIGELMDLKESFICRVRNGDRSLTLKRLQMLEKALDKPLSAILVEATPIDSAPKNLRPLYAAFRAFVTMLGEEGKPGASDLPHHGAVAG